MVEFAVSFPLVVLLLSGMFQIGYTLFVYNSLQKAVNAAARFGSVADYQVGGSDFAADVQNFAVYGTVSPGQSASTLAPGLTTDHIVVQGLTLDGTGIPKEISVSISGYQPPSIWPQFAMTFTNKPSARFDYMGQFIGD